jgi:hypothetical protein
MFSVVCGELVPPHSVLSKILPPTNPSNLQLADHLDAMG